MMGLARNYGLLWALNESKQFHLGLYAWLPDLLALLMSEQKAGRTLADVSLYSADPGTSVGLAFLTAMRRAKRGPDPSSFSAAARAVLARPRSSLVLGVRRSEELQEIAADSGRAFRWAVRMHRVAPPAGYARMLVAIESPGVAYLSGGVRDQPGGTNLS